MSRSDAATVYLVFEDDSTWMSCQNGDFHGTFSTREKAQAWIDAKNKKEPIGIGRFGYKIVADIVDAPQ